MLSWEELSLEEDLEGLTFSWVLLLEEELLTGVSDVEGLLVLVVVAAGVEVLVLLLLLRFGAVDTLLLSELLLFLPLF